jgi:elongation factor Ts
MMKCKQALDASDGDIQGAVDHLRKAGLKSAAKKASRDTAEGRVFAVGSGDGRCGTMVSIACETDFLSAGDGFKTLVDSFEAVVKASDPDGIDSGERPFLSQAIEGHENVGVALTDAVAVYGENIKVAELLRLENSAGQVGIYIHHDHKQGAIVSVNTEADQAKAEEALRALCQHIVVFNPPYANRESVEPEAIERERAIILEADDMKQKPEAVRGKIVDGRMIKFYASCVLVDQPWILDDKISVSKALENALGKGTTVKSFNLVKLG